MKLDKIIAAYALTLCVLTAIATFLAVTYQVIFGLWAWLPMTYALHLFAVIGYVSVMSKPRSES